MRHPLLASETGLDIFVKHENQPHGRVQGARGLI
jgi:hypothetical protein